MSQSERLKGLFSSIKALLSCKRRLRRWALGKLEVGGNQGNTTSGEQSTEKLTAGDGQAWAERRITPSGQSPISSYDSKTKII